MAAREIISFGFDSFGTSEFILQFGFGPSVEVQASSSADPKVLALTTSLSGQQRVYTPKTRYVTGDAFDEIRE